MTATIILYSEEYKNSINDIVLQETILLLHVANAPSLLSPISVIILLYAS